MNQSEGPASTISTGKIRALGSHALPGVDVALTEFPHAAVQKQLVQNLLDSTLSGTLCLTDAMTIEVNLDNVAAGHFVPSGASPDRRLWAEVIAYAGDQVIDQSGVVPPNASPDQSSPQAGADPDLWMLRDCLSDENDNPVPMFWDAAQVLSNAIPGPVKPVLTDATSFARSHVKYVYPSTAALPSKPDRITLRVLLKPVGDDILADLAASGHLDPAVASAIPQFEFAQTKLEWTAATAKPPVDTQTRSRVPGLSCVSSGTQYFNLPTVAVSHARCRP